MEVVFLKVSFCISVIGLVMLGISFVLMIWKDL